MIFRSFTALVLAIPSMLAILGAGPRDAQAQSTAPAGATVGPADLCPANLVVMSNAVGAVLGCWCSGEAPSGTVWGSGPYVVVSDLCGAARHAGVVGANGGAVWARVSAGLDAYEASTANGITALAFGHFGSSFEIIGTVSTGAGAAADGCPATAQQLTERTRCMCTPDQVGIGAIWGTDIYTYDSTLCTAALHAGAVTHKGGAVTVTPIEGQSSYEGSTRNGVTSGSYGAWGGSMRFD